MDKVIKNKIITLANGNKYFVLEEATKDDAIYDFILNIDDENKIEIVKQDTVDSKLILRSIKDESEKQEITNLFKNLLNKN